MRLALLASILSVLLMGCETSSDGDGAAGIIAYARQDEGVFLLLADHKHEDRGWASFGGGMQSGESPEDAAVREFNEETRCAFKPEEIRKRLDGSKKVRMGTFVSYVVEIDHVPVQNFTPEVPVLGCDGYDYDERANYAWVPMKKVLELVRSRRGEEPLLLDQKWLPKQVEARLFPAFVELLRQADTAGALPQP